MNRKLHLLFLLLFVVSLFTPFGVMAQVTIGDYTYTFSGDDATITASSLTSGDIVIPETVTYDNKTYNVTAISYKQVLFNGTPNSITGKSIKSISGGETASGPTSSYERMLFSRGATSKIDFPHLVSIKNSMFCSGNIPSINLPELESVEACQNFIGYNSTLTSLVLPKLKRIVGSFNSFYEDGALSSLSLPKLEVIDFNNQNVIYRLDNLISLDLPNLSIVRGVNSICDLKKLPSLSLPSLTEVDGRACISYLFILNNINIRNLKKIKDTEFLLYSPLSEVILGNDCELLMGYLFMGNNRSEKITVRGLTKIKNNSLIMDRFNMPDSPNKHISFPDLVEIENSSFGSSFKSVESLDMPKLEKIINCLNFVDDANNVDIFNINSISLSSLKEIIRSKLFSKAPLLTLKLRGDLKVDANSTINLKTYPTVVTITDEATVNDIPTSAFANVKGGRFIVPKGKAALYAQKWNLNTSKTMVYAPVDLKKTTAGTLYASGSITKADDSFTYGGTVYNNQYDFSHAMTEAESKNPSVLGDNDLGFTPTLSSLTVQNNTNVFAGYKFYYASAYADSPTRAYEGDLTLTALNADNVNSLQGFGTTATQLRKGIDRTIGGFLFKDNTTMFSEIYLPYTPAAITVSNNYLKAGEGITVKSRINNTYDFYWHPGDATYPIGFYECRNGISIPEYRAYLSFPKTASSNAKQFRLIFEDGETTGIESIVLPSDNARTADPEAWYTLLGTRLPAKPATAGVYIHGGRKVVVK